MDIFAKGIIVGLTVAMPLGPTGCLCLDCGLRKGFMASLCAGLGAAFADTTFALMAILGLAAMSFWSGSVQLGFAIVGGGFLLFFGIRKFFSPPSRTLQVAGGPDRVAAFGTTFLFTLANPLTILGMTVVLGASGYSAAKNPWYMSVLVLAGIFVGALVWYSVLATISTTLRGVLSSKILRILQRASSIAILVMGAYLLARGVMKVMG